MLRPCSPLTVWPSGLFTVRGGMLWARGNAKRCTNPLIFSAKFSDPSSGAEPQSVASYSHKTHTHTLYYNSFFTNHQTVKVRYTTDKWQTSEAVP